MQTLIAAAICGLMAILYLDHPMLFAQTTIQITLVGGMLELTSCLFLHFSCRAFRPELPRHDYLTDQKRKILVRIQAMQLTTGWFLIPISLGVLIRAAAHARTIRQTILLAFIVVLAATLAYCRGLDKIQRHLTPLLDDIDLELSIALHPRSCVLFWLFPVASFMLMSQLPFCCN